MLYIILYCLFASFILLFLFWYQILREFLFFSFPWKKSSFHFVEVQFRQLLHIVQFTNSAYIYSSHFIHIIKQNLFAVFLHEILACSGGKKELLMFFSALSFYNKFFKPDILRNTSVLVVFFQLMCVYVCERAHACEWVKWTKDHKIVHSISISNSMEIILNSSIIELKALYGCNMAGVAAAAASSHHSFLLSNKTGS